MGREISLGNGNIKFIKNNELTKGQEIKGRYVGDIEGKFGVAYKIVDAEGNTTGINASGQLKKKMALVAPGSLVTLTYGGKEAMEHGEYAGTEAHQFKVVVEEEGASAPAPQAAAAGGGKLPF